MALTVHQFPCLSDNYGFLIRDQDTGRVGVIDTPDADRILVEIEKLGWGRLDVIFNTHWHADHAGGNARLKAETGCEILGPQEVTRIAPLDRVLSGGEAVMLGQTRFAVLATPGHTLGHIAYWSEPDGVAFVGDTLFALGCGRLFEGTPEQMFTSLRTLAALPDATTVYCAHEYTASNARFALTVDDRPEMAEWTEAVFARRARGEPTVPTTISVERALNPFVRARDAAHFSNLRAGKDDFRG